MSRKSQYPIVLSCEENHQLQRIAAKYTLPYFQVLRAKMILPPPRGWAMIRLPRAWARAARW